LQPVFQAVDRAGSWKKAQVMLGDGESEEILALVFESRHAVGNDFFGLGG